jgi:hypothetical protein
LLAIDLPTNVERKKTEDRLIFKKLAKDKELEKTSGNIP